MSHPAIRRLVARHLGCVFTLLCAGGFLVAFLLWVGTGLLAETLLRDLTLRGAPPDVVVIASFRSELGGLLFSGLATLACLPWPLGLIRSGRLMLAALALLLTLAGGLVFALFYAEFAAVGRRDGRLVLVHLWPRPDVLLDPRAVTSTEIVTSTGPAGGGVAGFHALRIHSGGRTYTSKARIHAGLIEAARRVVQEAQASSR